MNATHSAYHRLLDALKATGHTANANGTSARTRCPNHKGKSNTSLSITAIEGTVLLLLSRRV
jgi:hypothetical protein